MIDSSPVALLLTSLASPSLDPSPPEASAPQINDGREDAAAAYSLLLRTEFFGAEAGPLSPSTPSKSVLSYSSREGKNSPMSPSKNIFRFKVDLRGVGSNSKPESPYSLSPVGGDGALTGAIASSRKAPRKIARSPYKVPLIRLFHGFQRQDRSFLV